MRDESSDRQGLQGFRRIACQPVPGRLNVGGQAVIEGVMMRSPASYATAVRTPDGEIVVKKTPYVSVTRRFPILNLPVFRGAVHLIETMVIGMSSLSFSAETAMEEDEDDRKKSKRDKGTGSSWVNKLALAGTLVLSLALGFLLFFFAPLWATELLGIDHGLLFNLVDGFFRLVAFLLYLLLISRWKEMDRIFQYHGAEHKSIYAYENGDDLVPENAAGYTRFHPRCGTSFLLVVMIVSILVFVMLGKPTSWPERFLRFAFIPVIGGIAFELIKLSARPSVQRWLWPAILPGLWLQKITTKEPTRDMLEVAIAALDACLETEDDVAVSELEPRQASAS